MCSVLRIAVVAAALLAFSLASCGDEQASSAGFAISMTDSGERILTDEHVAIYRWDQHRILLSPKGIDRWESFVEFDRSQDPPIRKLGRLTMKQFALTIDGVEMYRGHFSSMLSSLLGSGVLLYDTIGLPAGELWLTFTPSNGELQADPRGRPEIKAYFMERGKLRDHA